MVGLLFARHNSPLAKEEILPNLEYFHHRSGKIIDFFCSGHGAYWRPDDFLDKIEVAEGQGFKWLFSAQKFDLFRREIESETKWKYRGGVDLILINTIYDPVGETAALNFQSTLSFPLDKMKRDGTIYNVETFFEEIFSFAETYAGDNPTADFIDSQGIELLGSEPKNIGILTQRMNDALRRNDYAGVLHASVTSTLHCRK